MHGHQLEIASGLGTEDYVHFSQHWNAFQLRPVHAAQSLRVNVGISRVYSEVLFLWCHPSSQALFPVSGFYEQSRHEQG